MAIVAMVAPACATMQAGQAAPHQILETPEPPPRAVLELPAEPVAVDPDAVAVPVPTTSMPARTRTSHPRPTTPRPEPLPAAATPPPEPSTPLPDTPLPAITLQTTTDLGTAERRIREWLGRAQSDLALIDVRSLSAAGRTQYDAARRFVAQAEDAIKNRNFVFAEQLADKAAGLAAGLRTR